MKPKISLSVEDCCGCGACAAICPVTAISFQYNNEGFLYPHVDTSKCIGCLSCEKVCAFSKDRVKQIAPNLQASIYAAKHKNLDVLKKSSSGGMFTALSDLFITDGDMVACCTYSYEDNAVVFDFINNEDARDRARGSKYIQAEAGFAFKEIVNWLNQNPDKKMLVVGTGCQIAGLDLLLKKTNLREHTVLVDLVCHGVTSSGLWKNFVQNLEQQNNGKITYVTFKDKDNGWENPLAYTEIGGQRVTIKPFTDWFYMGWTIRESCYSCPYTRIDRNSDITIGDYWGIRAAIPQFYDKMGVSLVIAHSAQGRAVLKQAEEELVLCSSSREQCLQPRLISPQKRPKDRDAFWHDMQEKGIDYCAEKYVEQYTVPLVSKLKCLLKKILRIRRN